MKHRNLAAAYEPGAISLAEEAEYEYHVKPQPKLNKINRQLLNSLAV